MSLHYKGGLMILGLGIDDFAFIGIVLSLIWFYFYSVRRFNDPNQKRFRWFFGIIKFCFPLIGIYLLYKILEASTKENI